MEPTALARIAPWLRCPLCAAAVTVAGAVRCANRHSFDIARQGYVNLLPGNAKPARNADTAEMVAARARFLGAGHYTALSTVVAQHAPATGLVVDAGGGSGEYLAAVLDAGGDAGLSLDLSVPAGRRAARAHPRAAAAVTDLRGPLPLTDGAARLLLNVFSPRNPAEYHRVLHPGGTFLVVTPAAGHLTELVTALGLITVDAAKPARLDAMLSGHFTPAGHHPVTVTLRLTHPEVTDLVLMGPNAHHVDPAALTAAIAALPAPVTVTAAFTVATYRPR